MESSVFLQRYLHQTEVRIVQEHVLLIYITSNDKNNNNSKTYAVCLVRTFNH